MNKRNGMQWKSYSRIRTEKFLKDPQALVEVLVGFVSSHLKAQYASLLFLEFWYLFCV